MLTLYDSAPSGNCYKVRLLLAHLGLPYRRVDVDVTSGEPRPPGVLRHNPIGKVPVLILEDGSGIAESNAILWRLASGTEYLPPDPDVQLDVLRWLFFEQNVHEPTIAVNRFLLSYAEPTDDLDAVIAFHHRRGVAALRAMETHLETEPFFAGRTYTIADIALYAYTHVADEGGFDLDPFPAVRDWLDRVRVQPGHVPLTAETG